MMNFNVLHLLDLLKEQSLYLFAGLNHCLMYFLKFEKSVSVLTLSGKEFQMRGPFHSRNTERYGDKSLTTLVKLLSPYLSVLRECTFMLDCLCVNLYFSEIYFL